MVFERYLYKDPAILYYRHPSGSTPILQMRTLSDGRVELTFFRGADPLGPYYLPSETKAMRWIVRWMRARGREERLMGPEASWGAASGTNPAGFPRGRG